MSDKSEAPTQSRVEETRKEGRVARSLELNTAAILIVSAMVLKGPGGMILDGSKALILQAINALPLAAKPDYSFSEWPSSAVLQVGPGLMIMLLIFMAVGVIVTVSQTGFMWTSKKIGFDFSRLNPLKGFQRIFSKQGLIELVRALLKLVWVGGAAYFFLRGRTSSLLALGQTDFLTALVQWMDLVTALMMAIGSAYLVLAVGDYAFQRYRHMQSMKMTKQEVKEDYKRTEGDPMMKSRIRNQQRRMARNRMMSNVPKANVVITNPTHLAIAIAYDQDSMRAPRVMAKGAYLVAQRIVDIARGKRIPVVQNIPVARAIFRAVEVDQEIPPDLYMAVAEILAYVYRMGGKTPTNAAPAPASS
jgi:flagellar biosynthesis protein FlhB